LFKIVTAASLLEGGHANESTNVCYEGGEHDIRPSDLEHGGGTCVEFGEALGKSINMVFARMARKHLDAGELRRMASTLGFSGDIPIDVPVAGGRVEIPDDPFGMARAAAGFWNGKLSPLGALFAMQTIANQGERVSFVLKEGFTPNPTRGSAPLDPRQGQPWTLHGSSASRSNHKFSRALLCNFTCRSSKLRYFRRVEDSVLRFASSRR
jgi:peptidoglycan glycosyltransferase